jgi:pyruvate dehydrogenase E1 component subunit alpha
MKIMDSKRLRQLDERIAKEIDEAVAFAESTPLPEGADAVKGVYCEEDCFWQTAPNS